MNLIIAPMPTQNPWVWVLMGMGVGVGTQCWTLASTEDADVAEKNVGNTPDPEARSP